MRIRVVTLALLTALAGALLPGTAAQAATGFSAQITCDRTTNTVTTGVSAGFGSSFANLPVTAEFLVKSGSYVSDTTFGPIATGGRTTVPATTGPDGSLTVAGYTRSVPLSTYLFYTETVQVTVRNTATGTQIDAREATCSFDLHTTATLDCDTTAHTITARATGQNYGQSASAHVWYTYTQTFQGTKDSLRFTSHNLNPPDVSHNLSTTGGSWSDVGYVHNVGPDPYYLAETVEVLVWAPYDEGLAFRDILVGHRAATCVYADNDTA